MKGILNILFALALVLIMAFTLAAPVRAAAVTFTGDVEVDFTGPGVVIIPDPTGSGDVGLPLNAPPGTISGWDIKDLRLAYDAVSDIVYVGINSYGIAGDNDGDGIPGGTSAWLAANGGTDWPDLGISESISVWFDLNQDGTFDVVAGVPDVTEVSGFAVATSSSPSIQSWGMYTPLPTHTGSYHGNPGVGDPDFEFTVTNWSTLPGHDMLPNFDLAVYSGSYNDDGIGEDILFASTEFEETPIECVTAATDTGTACFTASNGTIEDLEALSAIPPGAPAGIMFPHGMFSFKITGLELGQEVTVTIELPEPVSPHTRWWKEHMGGWYSIPVDIIEPNVIAVTLTDGVFPGDSDKTEDGTITDPGGPGDPGSVGWETYRVSKLPVLLPWIALFAAIAGGVSLVVLRHRRAQS